MKKFYRSIIILTVVLITVISCASAATSLYFQPDDISIGQGSTTKLDIVLDEVPAGLAGYQFRLDITNQEYGEITGISFPEWASLNNATATPADTILISGVDLGRKIQSGGSDIVLGTVSVRGDKPGVFSIAFSDIQIDADGGDLIRPEVLSASISVSGTSETTRNPAQTHTTGITAAPYTVTTTAGSGMIPITCIGAVMVFIFLFVYRRE